MGFAIASVDGVSCYLAYTRSLSPNYFRRWMTGNPFWVIGDISAVTSSHWQIGVFLPHCFGLIERITVSSSAILNG